MGPVPSATVLNRPLGHLLPAPAWTLGRTDPSPSFRKCQDARRRFRRTSAMWTTPSVGGSQRWRYSRAAAAPHVVLPGAYRERGRLTSLD